MTRAVDWDVKPQTKETNHHMGVFMSNPDFVA